jgi:thiol-disulfide isomerase/thioredoxin
MALTESDMTRLETHLPAFELLDVRKDDNRYSVSSGSRDKPILIVFICNHCPYVVHIIEEMVSVADEYKGRVDTVFISSNDAKSYPDDAPDKMRVFAEKYKFNVPYLYDESQNIAKLFSAQCTPDFFLYDCSGMLVYGGQFDDARPGNDEVITGESLKKAMDAVLSGDPVSGKQLPGCGCSIKWKQT